MQEGTEQRHVCANQHQRWSWGVAQHHDSLGAIGPFWKGHQCFIGPASDDHGVDVRKEFGVSVRLAASFGQEVEAAVLAGEEAEQAGSHKYGRGHGLLLSTRLPGLSSCWPAEAIPDEIPLRKTPG